MNEARFEGDFSDAEMTRTFVEDANDQLRRLGPCPEHGETAALEDRGGELGLRVCCEAWRLRAKERLGAEDE